MKNENLFMLIDRTKMAEKRLSALPCLPLDAGDMEFIYRPAEFKKEIIQQIRQAKQRIYITALYWQKDEAGKEILDEVLQAKARNPELDVKILVDWHRAQRNLLGAAKTQTNADWYCEECSCLSCHEILFFGVPINTREVFGVLHVKGFVFDDTILYSGASINNVYLHHGERYRFDRYHKIKNTALANSLVDFINGYLLDPAAVHALDKANPVKTKEIRAAIKNYRKNLAQSGHYNFIPSMNKKDVQHMLTVSPLFGLGKTGNKLNRVIQNLFQVVENKLTICTPYFNFPLPLQKRLKWLLKQGKQVEIIVGDKTANDFYIPPSEPFKMAGGLPYLYENNLRHFSKKFDDYIQSGQLVIRIWKDGDNSYHLKGVWVDNDYMLLTGNNLNPRAWRLDAENGLLIHDPNHELTAKADEELALIRQHTTILKSYTELETMDDYPAPVQKLLKKFRRLKADAVVKMIL